MLKLALAAVLSTLAVVSCAAADASEPNHADHEELRALLQNIQQGINSQKYEDLAPYFDENMRVTPINQEVLSSRADIAPYFKKWFGPGGYLKSLRFTLTADAPTEFYGGKTIGVVRGSGEEQYVLADGRAFDIATRWTATVRKGDDGKWRILALHIGTNFLDNPILAAAKSALVRIAAVGFAAGALIGGLIAFFLARRKKIA